jgi:CheY-like chemotaxis protein
MKRNVIYVDGDLESYILISEALFNRDIKIVYADRGIEAIELFRSNASFDLVITELQLPDMDGFMLLDEIRKINPAIPVIALTSFKVSNLSNWCLVDNFNYVIQKPFALESIIPKVERSLDLVHQ